MAPYKPAQSPWLADRRLRARGLTAQKENFNKSNTTEEPKTDGLPLPYIIPGLWLNASKSGISASIGGHGATLNVNRNGGNHNLSHDSAPSVLLVVESRRLKGYGWTSRVSITSRKSQCSLKLARFSGSKMAVDPSIAQEMPISALF